MAYGKLTRETLVGLARAAGIDLSAVPVETLIKGDMPVVWEGILRFDELDIQNEVPAFVSVLEEGGDGS